MTFFNQSFGSGDLSCRGLQGLSRADKRRSSPWTSRAFQKPLKSLSEPSNPILPRAALGLTRVFHGLHGPFRPLKVLQKAFPESSRAFQESFKDIQFKCLPGHSRTSSSSSSSSSSWWSSSEKCAVGREAYLCISSSQWRDAEWPPTLLTTSDDDHGDEDHDDWSLIIDFFYHWSLIIDFLLLIIVDWWMMIDYWWLMMKI